MRNILLFLFAITLSLSFAQTHVELILDASGSMWNKLANEEYRIVAAKEALSNFLSGLPSNPDLHVGLRIYGSKLNALDEGSCKDTELFIPIAGLARDELLNTVRETSAKGATPIAYSLELAAKDFPREGKKIVILVTDGEESCGGDIEATLENLKDQGIDFDLNIIGFDLDASASESFAGLGTFVNAKSAPELAQALGETLPQVVNESIENYPVTVHVSVDGIPVSADVLFSHGISDEETSMAEIDLGTYRASLTAGSYRAFVSTAELSQQFSALYVTPEGENVFRLELHIPDVTLTVPEQRFLAGGRFTVAYEGAPALKGDIIALAPVDSPETVFLNLANVRMPSDEISLELPDEIGIFEARYYLQNEDGSSRLIAKSNSFTTTLPEVVLGAPTEADAGSEIEVTIEGSSNPEDYLVIVPAESPENLLLIPFSAHPDTNLISLTVPNDAGAYEIRYQLAQTRRVISRLPLQIAALKVSLFAATEARAGSKLEVRYEGTSSPDDYIAIVPVGSSEGTLTFAFATQLNRAENPLMVQVPGEVGSYELRYVTGGKRVVYASSPLSVLPLNIRLSALSEADAGGKIEVLVEGDFNPDDFVAIVPAGSPASNLRNNFAATLKNGDQLSINLPKEPGAYEIRYLTVVAGRTVHASIPLTLR